MKLYVVVDASGVPIKDPTGRFAALFDDLETARKALERARNVRDAACTLAELVGATLQRVS